MAASSAAPIRTPCARGVSGAATTTQSLSRNSSPSPDASYECAAPGTLRPVCVSASDATPSAPSRRISSVPTPPAPIDAGDRAGQAPATRRPPRRGAHAQRQLARRGQDQGEHVLGHRPRADALGRRPRALAIDDAVGEPGVHAGGAELHPADPGCEQPPSSGGSSPVQISRHRLRRRARSRPLRARSRRRCRAARAARSQRAVGSHLRRDPSACVDQFGIQPSPAYALRTSAASSISMPRPGSSAAPK